MKLYQLSAFALAGSMAAAAQAYPTEILGTSVPAASATRTVVVTSATRSVDVAYGEAVKFDVNGQSFAWKFYTPARSFDLNQVSGVALPQPVRVYVGPDTMNNE